MKYTGKPFPFHTPEGRVALVIEIEKALRQAAIREYAAEVESGVMEPVDG